MGKKYIKEKQLGNKGEAFFESLFSEYALVHRVDASKDLGIDFLCEWVHGEKPSRLLFGVQVKTRSKVKKENLGKSRLNALQQYKIGNAPSIDGETLDYWSGFDFPIFTFLINFSGSRVDVFYKRYTPILHRTSKEGDECFYKVNRGNKLLISPKRDNGRSGGFCRDLYIDYKRCLHNKGILSGIDPNDLGLVGYNKDDVYDDIITKYKDKIIATLKKYEKIKDRI